MPDQADQLRSLMHSAVRARSSGPAPRLFVVAGAKGGVGATTVAVNLAVALAAKGRSTVLVDGDLGQADVGAFFGLHGGPTIVDVLAARHNVGEALRHGPAGLRILPGAWATGHLTDCNASAQQRLIGELKDLRDITTVVIDAGCGLHRVVDRFWRSADQVLLVTTPDDTSVMDAYAMVKAMSGRRCAAPTHAVVNRAARCTDAHDAHGRLARACRRFLAIDVPCVAHLMASAEVAAAARQPAPFVLSAPFCLATRSIEQLARFVAASACVDAEREIISSPDEKKMPAFVKRFKPRESDIR